MKLLVLAFALLGACKAKDEAKDKLDTAADKLGAAKDEARDKLGTAADKLGAAKDRGAEVVGDTTSVFGTVRDKLGAAKDKVVDTASDAVGLARRAKAELDKVYRSTHAWDLDVEDAGAEATREHEAKLDKLPSVSVNGVRVGYEEDAKLSLRGTAYAKHFRASWKRGDKIVRVSFYTQDELDVIAFGELLEKLVPAVERVL